MKRVLPLLFVLVVGCPDNADDDLGGADASGAPDGGAPDDVPVGPDVPVADARVDDAGPDAGTLCVGLLGETCDDGDPCTHTDECVAIGRCAGTPITCTSDSCATRTCNGTDRCDEIRHGDAVYETFDTGGWDYSTTASTTGTLIYRTPVRDQVTYILAAPGIGDRMQSFVTDEANTCDWCFCAAACAFSYTGRDILLATDQAPGMVPLFRFMNGNPIQHRSALASPIGPAWNQEFVLGYVCAP